MMSAAYVQWVLMVKDDTEKLVHPGNVVNHEHFGWTRKVPVVTNEAHPGLSLPELAEQLLEAETNTAAIATPVSTETETVSGHEVLSVKQSKPRKSRKG